MPVDVETKRRAVDAYVKAFADADIAQVMAIYAEDATVEDPVGTPIIAGHAAIRAFYEGALKTGAKLTLEGPVRTPTDLAVFPFSVHLDFAGGKKRIDVVDHFRFNADGKVVEMRAFWGPADMVDV